jgi:carboxypeptidase family protein
VKAIRSLGGKVMTYDKSAAQTVPLAGVTVRLKELSLETHTGSNGAYLFRNLPAGTFTVVVEFEGRESTQVVTVPPEPASIRDIDLNVSSK